MLRGVCYFFGVIFILGGLLLLVSYHLFLGIGGMIIGIILIAIGHKASGGNGGQGGSQSGGDSGGGGKKWWELTDEQKRAASWYYTYGPGKKR
jgi:hypothetical protein